jgi:hypothetical protein
MSLSFLYGQHFPNGLQAFSWVTSPTYGTYRTLPKIEYIWNYYDFPTPMPPNHPYDKSSLISYADGTNFATCRDANAHLLFDFNHDGELDTNYPSAGSFAFMEHSGRGVNNEKKGNPFSNFWFDDNSLAQFMSQTYSNSIPSGLHEYDDFTRWRIVGGNATNWTPYSSPNNYNDQLALNGLYYLAVKETSQATNCWKRILSNSGATYNSELQRFDYPGIHESYHFGLWLILTSFLHELDLTDSTLLQHYVSIRSNVLSIQIMDSSLTTLSSGPFYGWTSDAAGGNSLMNTESVSTNVLGLGANALFSYEIGRDPLKKDEHGNYFLRSHNVLSGVEGLSHSGYLSYGPYVTLTSGEYHLELFFRSGSLTSTSSTLSTVLLKVDVYDSKNGVILVQKDIVGKEFALSNQWKSISLSFQVTNSANSLEFRVWYEGKENIDVSHLRIKPGK